MPAATPPRTIGRRTALRRLAAMGAALPLVALGLACNDGEELASTTTDAVPAPHQDTPPDAASIAALGAVGVPIASTPAVAARISRAASETVEVDLDTVDASDPVAGGAVHINPVVATNCPDPGVYEEGGVYYMVCTTHVLPAFPIRTSNDLVNWTQTGEYVFTSANKPVWADDHFWAPEIHRVSGRYVLYYTARNRSTNTLCIGVATSASPTGPYTDIGEPLISEEVAALDASFFADDDGRQYLYWKADAAWRDPSGPIWVQELSADGLALVGSRSAVLRSDLEWEGRLVEAPQVAKRDGRYYLFYSGGKFDTPSYAVGVARSFSPIGGFVKKGDPILRTGGRWKGPGHGSVVAYEGDAYMLYHAWEGEQFVDVRQCLLDRIAWTDEGWPLVNDGTPSEPDQT